MKMVLIVALVGVFIVSILMLLRRGGPSITTIEHRRDRDEPEDRE